MSSLPLPLTSEELMARIMAKAIDEIPPSANPLKKYHVSQTADQLPDVRLKQALYRAELEKQMEERRELERRRRELEAEEAERMELKLQAEREKLRREWLEEMEARKLKQEEARRRQAVIAKRLEEIKEAAERKKQAEAEKRKRFYLEHLYNNSNPVQRSSYLTAYYSSKPWNSRDYVHAALDLSLEEVYKSAPLHLVADVYKKLDYEKAKIREIIRARLKEEDDM